MDKAQPCEESKEYGTRPLHDEKDDSFLTHARPPGHFIAPGTTALPSSTPYLREHAISCVNVRCRSLPIAGAVLSSEERRPSHLELGALLLVSHLELGAPAFAFSNLDARTLSKYLRGYPFDMHLALYRLPYLVFFRIRTNA